jgi:patatin-like phospholipase
MASIPRNRNRGSVDRNSSFNIGWSRSTLQVHAVTSSFKEKLLEKSQHKLLALDGGGIRGVITLEILAAIENQLQTQFGRGDDFVLAEYFDYIAGTSTGAIIAACLSLGLRVSDILGFYVESGPLMFAKARWFHTFWYKYDSTPLAKMLQSKFGADTEFGSEKLKTLLMLVLRDATTDSPWPLTNNPTAKYNTPITRPGCNLKFPLWQLVRASTAAPTFFPAESIVIDERRHLFVDGGLTMYNNPAFHLFLMATAEPYHLNWPADENKLLLVSVGTGSGANARSKLSPHEMHLLYNASSIPAALMFAALNEQDFLCRVFGKCIVGGWLDREVEDMIGKRGPAVPKLFSYLRYNADLTGDGLKGLGLPQIKPEHVQKMDSVNYIDELREVGQAAAQRVTIREFNDFLS